MKVEIWSDIACPWCAVGKRRFERALASFSHRDDVEVEWRSFELDPHAPRIHGVPAVELLSRKYGVPVEQARAMNARLTGEAAKEGLAFELERLQVGNTFDAHRLIHHAHAHGRRDAMVERLFRAYLSEGAALGDVEVLARLAGEVGLDVDDSRAMLAGSGFASEVRADEARARDFGITGVPFFAIDERYGISGAQPPEAFLAALTQAWEEDAGPTAAVSTSDAVGNADEGCEGGSCAT